MEFSGSRVTMVINSLFQGGFINILFPTINVVSYINVFPNIKSFDY